MIRCSIKAIEESQTAHESRRTAQQSAHRGAVRLECLARVATNADWCGERREARCTYAGYSVVRYQEFMAAGTWVFWSAIRSLWLLGDKSFQFFFVAVETGVQCMASVV
ncbi:hypothetical protein J6590_020299 [Homalodisca vitripennis]|nr:hypothetical protein J6590_020299 [Homalodisca vitripennis]